MTKEELQTLFQKYHDGTATEAERALLEAWYLQHNESDAKILSRQAIEAARAQVYRRLPGNEAEFLKIGVRMMAAAALIGLLITMTVLFLTVPKPNGTKLVRSDIPPGGNSAVLTLPSGRHLDLTAAKKGHLFRSDGVEITKSKDGEVRFSYAGTGTSPEKHTVSTPKGGQWQVRLADGTVVWLNAASSLTFPTSFSRSASRTVQLSGEGYFEVAKDPAHPFIVRSGNQRVEVLGTHFNISSYADDPAISTTLTEGRIRVNLSGGGQPKILAPGEQALTTSSGITVKAANTEEALAWKNGYFRFNDEPVTSVMKKLARWYNVEVRYVGVVPAERLNGKVSRTKNISQVIKALEATGTIHIKMEGRRITVMR